MFERCRKTVRAEDLTFLRELDRELYRLYTTSAWRALLAKDLKGFHGFSMSMARTATSEREEILTLLTLSEWQGDSKEKG